MYSPAAFRVADRHRLHQLIDDESFAILCCAGDRPDEPPLATHLPLLLERDAGPLGVLWGHVAAASPHADRLFDRPQTAIFSGPHAYVSPTWYAEPGTVPTWNYLAVHASGAPQPLDAAATLDLLVRLTARYEQALPQPWTFDPTAEAIQRLAQQVVGFRLPIAQLDGKWKLNQNHPPDRRERVRAALAAQANPQAQAVARAMTPPAASS